jgi:hypothetical protein
MFHHLVNIVKDENMNPNTFDPELDISDSDFTDMFLLTMDIQDDIHEVIKVESALNNYVEFYNIKLASTPEAMTSLEAFVDVASLEDFGSDIKDRLIELWEKFIDFVKEKFRTIYNFFKTLKTKILLKLAKPLTPLKLDVNKTDTLKFNLVTHKQLNNVINELSQNILDLNQMIEIAGEIIYSKFGSNTFVGVIKKLDISTKEAKLATTKKLIDDTKPTELTFVEAGYGNRDDLALSTSESFHEKISKPIDNLLKTLDEFDKFIKDLDMKAVTITDKKLYKAYKEDLQKKNLAIMQVLKFAGQITPQVTKISKWLHELSYALGRLKKI